MNVVHNLKRFSAGALACVFTFLVIITGLPTASAADDSQGTAYTQELGDGYTAEVIISVDPSLTRDTTKTAHATSTIKDSSGNWVATITLHATFMYNGITAGVTGTTYSKSLASGWSYTNHKITSSEVSTSNGADATLTANLRKFLSNVPINISIHCSPKGVITYR